MSKKITGLIRRIRRRRQQNEHGEESAIVKAAKAGDADVLRRVLNGAAHNQLTLDLALYRAVQEQSLRCVTLLLEAGANSDAKPVVQLHREGYRPPIVMAVSQGCLDIARILIQKECIVDNVETGNKGFTALHYAVFNENQKAIQLLLDAKADVTRKGTHFKSPLFLAVERNYKTGLEMLLSCGNCVNHRDIDMTLLHYAVQCGHLHIVMLLIVMGADPNVTDCRCYTPLMEAVIRHKTQIARYLVACCDVNYRGQRDITALMLSAQVNHVEGIHILLDAGADVNLRDSTGNTALTMAGPHMNALHQLLGAGADPNVQNGFGMTPLWYGAYYHHIDAVKVLLRANACAEIKAKNFEDEFHTSPLEIALKRHHWDISKMIILAGMVSPSALLNIHNNCDSIIPRADNVRDSVRDLVAYIEQMLYAPRSLKFWCRKAMHKQLGSIKVKDKMDDLPIPEALKSYLGLPELDDPDLLKDLKFL